MLCLLCVCRTWWDVALFSQDEFLDFFNLRLKDKYREFLKKEAWRNSPHQQGSAGSQDDAEYDSGGGEDGGGGGAASTASGGEGSAAGDPAPKAGLDVKIDGQTVRISCRACGQSHLQSIEVLLER